MNIYILGDHILDDRITLVFPPNKRTYRLRGQTEVNRFPVSISQLESMMAFQFSVQNVIYHAKAANFALKV